MVRRPPLSVAVLRNSRTWVTLLCLLCTDRLVGYATAKSIKEYSSFRIFVHESPREYFASRDEDAQSAFSDIDPFPLSRQTNGGASILLNSRDSIVALTDGEADEQVFFTFIPAENRTIDDYTLVPSIGNLDVLQESDTSIIYTEDLSQGYLSYNVTVQLDFNKWVGITSIGLQAVNDSTSSTLASSPSAQITVVGMTFYTPRSDGNTSIIGGPNYPLIVPAEQSASDFYLNVFIQYVDGSTSNEVLTVPPSSVIVSPVDLDGQVEYNESCSSIAGTFDGSDVSFPDGCGMGFSTNELNGDYIGAKFGIDFEPYKNGSFTIGMQWNELVEGSDLEIEGYSTYINTSITGEVPLLVRQITPFGPFQTTGTEEVTVNVENLPANILDSESWLYELSILFAEGERSATYNDGSRSFQPNGTTFLTFTLPAGAGSSLPWNLTMTKPSAEVLQAVDLTTPPYVFSFLGGLLITEIIPGFGPEEGGTIVSVIGEFPDPESADLGITFADVLLDPSLILFTSSTNVTFRTPSRQSVASGSDVNVTVVIDDLTSNAVIFSYVTTVILESLAPPTGPVEGGTTVTLTGQLGGFESAADDSGIYFNDQRIDPVLVQSANSSTIIFKTPAHSSFELGDTYSYDVSVAVSGNFSNTMPFTYEAPPEILSISPASGDEAGGTMILLTGSFEKFNLSNSAIYFGGKKVDSEDLVFNQTTIQFPSPARIEVGSAYSYEIWVSVGVQESNRVTFTYEDINAGASIDASGCSGDPTGGFCSIGACVDSTFRASLSSGARNQNPTYKWSLFIEGSSVDLLLSENVVSDAEVLYLPYRVFQAQGSPHTLSLDVQTDFSSLQLNRTLVHLSIQSIGVKISDPQPRSFSNPNVSLTIPADIGLPGCSDEEQVTNSTAITYVWVYRGINYVFSHQNKTAPEDEISPTLLGREFHIPQPLMEYGVFDLRLTAYFTEDESIRGSDGTTVTIEPAPLLAQINGGELTQFISGSQDVEMSALQSSDPDSLYEKDSADLVYGWSCRYAWDATMSDALTCPDDLLSSSASDASSFRLSAASFDSVRNTTSNVHIEYSLQVSKTSVNATGSDIFRVSAVTESVLILVKEESQRFEALEQVQVINNQSNLVDRRKVKYYEDLTITPTSETDETTWTFEVISPASDSRTLLASDENLLTLPGYFSNGQQAGRYSLGLKANVLSPNTEYLFLISTFRTNFAVNEQVISLTTVEKPEVFLGGLSTPTGNVNETFALSAFTSYESSFKFFFMLTDGFGFESCVGGCQGEDFVKFRLATPGSYAVRCDVYDWLGFTRLASKVGDNITVVSLPVLDTAMQVFAADANDAFLAGDHSDYQQLGADMVKYVWSNGQSPNPENDSQILSDFVEGMNQIAANALPNAIQSAAYVRVAAALASLTPELGITYDIETLYYLVNITVSAVERVSDNGALQQLEELLDFYDLTPSLVLATFSEGTSRRRLLQEPQDVEADIRIIWVDLYEAMKDQLAVTVLKSCPCGCVQEVQTGFPSAAQESFTLRRSLSRQSANLPLAATYVNPTQGSLSPVRMKFAHFCNSEQGSSLILNRDTEKEVQFGWCKALFENSIKKLYFAVAETPDYVYLSQIRRNVTLSDGLVSTSVSRIDGNTIRDATLPIDACYNLRIPLPRNLTTALENAASTEYVPRGLRLAPRKSWGSNETEGLYSPVFDGTTIVEDSEATRNSSYTTALITGSATGVFAIATRIAWPGTALSLEGVFVTAAEVAGVTMIIFVLILIATVSAWMVATRLSAVAGTAPPVEADFTYVERDVYGRGTAIDMMEDQEAYSRRE